MVKDHSDSERRKEGNILFNDALNTFYIQLYGIRYMVKGHSDNERGNPLHGLLFPISSKGSFICLCYTSCGALAGTSLRDAVAKSLAIMLICSGFTSLY